MDRPARCILGWALVLPWAVLAAQPVSPEPGSLDTPACREALAALQAEQTRGPGVSPAPLSARSAVPSAASGAAVPAMPPTPAGSPRLQAARERAVRACLGGAATSRPTPIPQAPQAVAPAARPSPLPPLHSPAGPPAAIAPPAGSGMPLTVLACDSTGCIASDGTRLNKVGPKGACTLEGAVLRCPP